MSTTYSCIIPAYNEYPRILDVLKSMALVPELSEIIVVDDGSSDPTTQKVKQNFPQIKVFTHSQNRGKLQAVRTGLTACAGDNVILMDGDLLGLKHEEISQAIKAFETNRLDCLLLCTVPTSLGDVLARKLTGLPHAATGCRILKRNVLENALNSTHTKGYQLEPIQNKYLMDNKLSIAYTNISAVGIHKIKKVGLIRGIHEEIVMWKQVLSHSNIAFNIRQARIFARKKV